MNSPCERYGRLKSWTPRAISAGNAAAEVPGIKRVHNVDTRALLLFNDSLMKTVAARAFVAAHFHPVK
jgi:hypothetical protein